MLKKLPRSVGQVDSVFAAKAWRDAADGVIEINVSAAATKKLHEVFPQRLVLSALFHHR
jgi:hypothetical protein